ncbi:hypothetical protein AURDEDRAFT_176230 [Auricularia subglabra TFB-10046 SS5]|uniref:Uncharacterized protein n=1 Tax=Auricularia subglabra (strain TFB-10046 / SS5) TaxID=717982 RepID=J0D710_AURST|nr:hypothetical protein AURDEDRAFT_176230 [Auricularia subglabra TFB-10046 SS5]
MLIVDEDIPPLMDMSDDEDDIPDELGEPKAPDRCIPIEVYALDNRDRFGIEVFQQLKKTTQATS